MRDWRAWLMFAAAILLLVGLGFRFR